MSKQPQPSSGAFSKSAADFRVGQRVQMSQHAHNNGLKPGKSAGTKGTVVALTPPFKITVIQDEYKHARSWAAWFWEPEQKPHRPDA